MVMASTSELMRPLKRSTMPLVCGVRGLIWRYSAPSSAQTLAKAWVKQLPLSVNTCVMRKGNATAASRRKAMALASVSSSLTARWTERERRAVGAERKGVRPAAWAGGGGGGRRREGACAGRHGRSAAWAEQPKVPAAQRVEWLRREVLDVDVHEAKVVVLEGALAFGGLRRCWLGAAIEARGLEDAPDAVAVEMRQEMCNDKRQVIEREVGDPAQRADNGALFFGCLLGQLVRPRRVVQAIGRTPLAPLADGLGGHAIALAKEAAALLGAGDLGAGDGRGAGVRMDLQHRSALPLSGLDQTVEQV